MTVSVCNMMTDPKGRELLQHGTAQFPVACYQDDLAREILPWHWHEELEAAVITEGTAVVSAGTEKYVIKAGGGFFINSGVLHAAQSADTSACRFHSLVFHPRLVGGGADSIFWQKYIQPLMNDVSLKGLSFQPSVPWEKEVLEAVESAWQSCHGEEAIGQDAAGCRSDETDAPVYSGAFWRRDNDCTDCRKCFCQRKRVSALLPEKHWHHTDSVCEAVPDTEGGGAFACHGTENCGYWNSVWISGNELFCKKLPGTAGMYAVAVPAAGERRLAGERRAECSLRIFC